MPTKAPRKQRWNLHNLALHLRHRQVSAHLSDELLRKYKRRAFPLRVGDTVKVLRGDQKDHTGKVLSVDHKEYRIQVDGVTVRKARGSEVARPIHPSNVVITKLNLQDARRRERLAAKGVVVEAPEPEAPAPAAPSAAEAPAAAGANEEGEAR